MTVDVRERTPSAASAPSHGRRRDIQGLRAVAVLLVIAFHARLPVPGGFIGVDVFFVISGFVITAMLMREWSHEGRIRFGRFYLRRFLRLTPALAVLVGAVALASLLLQNPFGAQQTTARTGIGAMLLAANYVIGHAAGDYFASDAVTNPLLHTWSLSVEEQFYLVFPALLALGWILARRRRGAALAVVGAVAAGSFVLSLLWSFGSPLAAGLTQAFGGAESFAFYSSPTRAWEFAVGALLAMLLPRLPALSVGVSRALGLLGAAGIALAAFTLSEGQPFPGIVALLPVTGTMLVILAGSHLTTGVSSALSVRPMVALGDLSYSWYLWHWPVIVFTALLFPNATGLLVVAAVASIVPALLSYRLVEQPLRRLRPRSRGQATRLVATTVGVPVALCAALLAGASTGWGLTPSSAGEAAPARAEGGDPQAIDATASTTPLVDDGEVAGGDGGSLRSQHVLVKAGCVNIDLDPTACRFGPEGADGALLLAGDSQAYALADGVIEAGSRLGLATVATSHTGCPFLARESSGVHNYPCRSWQESIVAYALKERPAAVVIANRSGGYVRPGNDWRTVARDDGGRADSVAEASDLYRRGLEPVVRDLTDAGIPVVLIAAVPEMDGYTDPTSLLSQALETQAFEVARSDAERYRRPALRVEQAISDSSPRVTVYDPIPDLCTEDACSTVRDGEPVYQDETHLAVPGSLLLAEGVADALRRVGVETRPPPR